MNPPAPTVSFPSPAGWRRWVAFDHCRVLLPQFAFARRNDSLARLHRLSLDDDRPLPFAPGRLGQVFARLAFAGVALRQIGVFFLRYGSYVSSHDHIPRWRQLHDLWHCVWFQNRYARHYYWRKLYRLPDRTQWLYNLEHRQLTTLLRHLNRRLPIERVTNKFNFHEHCRAHGLPTPDVLGAWDRQGRPLTPPVAPVKGDLFLKPAGDFGSRGLVILRWDFATDTHRFESRSLSWPDLLAALGHAAHRDRHSLVLQPRLRNARRNAVYGNYDLCNLRIVTARPPDGEPEALGSFIRLPSPYTTGGYDRNVLFAHVDVQSGCMATGRLREITHGEFHFHPETQAPISGRMIPGWAEMLRLALQAHRTMPWLPFVGWDIIDTAHGIMLLEANAYWGGDALQPPGGLPLGATRFPQIYLDWFDRMYGPAPRRPRPPAPPEPADEPVPATVP